MGDARTFVVPANSVDLVVTSPPYWSKRDYGIAGQIGMEPSPGEYVAAITDCLRHWRPMLRPHGSIFLNIGDSYHRNSLAGIPAAIEAAAMHNGWKIRNRIVWTKDGGMPEPASNRLAGRHEYIIHLALTSSLYYYDLHGYAATMGNGANPGDVWHIPQERNMGTHLAPYPAELARRCILLACPEQVCAACGQPRRRIVARTRQLDTGRPQGKRAMELATDLTDDHIAAIQATGISDVGKATRTQTGTGRNSVDVQRLAAEAKAVLGGYFREFTFAKKVTTGWTDCGCDAAWLQGTVLDPFVGTGTTVNVATGMGRTAIGVDLDLTSAPAATITGALLGPES